MSASLSAGQAPNVLILDLDGALVGAKDSRDDTEEGGLPAARRADDEQHFLKMGVERNLLNRVGSRLAFAEPFAQVPCFDGVHAQLRKMSKGSILSTRRIAM